METIKNELLQQNKVFIWLAAVTGFLLLIPLVAMQFTSEVDWQLSDFATMGALIFGMGSFFVLVARQVQRTSSRIIVGVMFLMLLLYVWAELAVGVFTNFGS